MTIFVRKPNKKDWLVRPILNEKRETRLELATACLEENLTFRKRSSETPGSALMADQEHFLGTRAARTKALAEQNTKASAISKR